MIRTFLNAKHWQLFLLLFGLPFVFYIVWIVSFFTGFINEIDAESAEFPTELFDGLIIFMMLMMIPVAVMYGWFWSMAIGLQSYLPEGMVMKVQLFKVFFLIPVIYFFLYMLFYISFLGNIEHIEDMDYLDDISNLGTIVVSVVFFIFLSLFVVFCTFYQYWFIAKTIKSAELGKEAVFSEFVGEFFLLWFYPIGVWILQPMVNKITASK